MCLVALVRGVLLPKEKQTNKQVYYVSSVCHQPAILSGQEQLCLPVLMRERHLLEECSASPSYCVFTVGFLSLIGWKVLFFIKQSKTIEKAKALCFKARKRSGTFPS